jgi:hypothetical protein
LVLVMAATLGAYVSSSRSAGTATPAQEPGAADTPEARLAVAAFRSASRSATTGFAPSLEMKENMDFLLTPALLVQEAMSEDVVATYPSE